LAPNQRNKVPQRKEGRKKYWLKENRSQGPPSVSPKKRKNFQGPWGKAFKEGGVKIPELG